MCQIADKKIVAIGGGTGLSTMLRGLKAYTEHITAIVTVADDGGRSGMIREDLHLLPPGDIRNCIMALADTEPIMEKLMTYRFDGGRLKGQSFGNLFLAAMCGISDNFEQAVRRVSDVLAVKGRVLPVTEQNVSLGAEFEDGTIVVGESVIPKKSAEYGSRISNVFLSPKCVRPLPDCLKAIAEADLIVLGPGSLYTSIIPNLLVEGVPEAILNSRARTVYVCNVMTQMGESDDMTAFDHVKAVTGHAGGNIIDACIVNTQPVPADLQEKYKTEFAAPVEVDETRFAGSGVRLLKRELLDVSKGYARHDYRRLAEVIAQLAVEV